MRWKDLKSSYRDRIVAMEAMAPHELLGVHADAEVMEIRAAYLKLVKTYHPDKADPFMARHNEEVMKLINAAFQKLQNRP